MRQFNLKEYLANPSRKVVTRSGRNVKIHCTNYSIKPIIAEIECMGYSDSFYSDGKFNKEGDSWNDLFFAPEKHEGWVNIFKGEDYHHIGDAFIYKSREEAEKLGKGFSNYLATSKIEWEE